MSASGKGAAWTRTAAPDPIQQEEQAMNTTSTKVRAGDGNGLDPHGRP